MQCFSFRFAAMGSQCGAHIFAEHSTDAEQAAEAVIAEVQRIGARYSRYTDTSETSRINRAAAQGQDVTLDAETCGLLNLAYRFHRLSGGLFDITSGVLRKAWDFSAQRLPSQDRVRALLPYVGMEHLARRGRVLHFGKPGLDLDFGGIAKEYASDRAARICRDHGLRHALVDLGGDISVTGPLPDGLPWRIHVRHPLQTEELFSILEISGGGVATSGDYERFIEVDGKKYCHILNPKTGFPVQAMASVTVMAANCRLAGGLSTSAMLMEKYAPAWLEKTHRAYGWFGTDGTFGGPLFSELATQGGIVSAAA